MPPLLLRAVGLETRRVTARTGAALPRGALEARSGPSHCPLSLSCGTAALAPSVRRVSTLLSDTRRAGSLRIRTRTLSVRAESTPNGVGKRKAPKAPKHLGSIESHPDIGEGREFTLVRNFLEGDGKRNRRWVTLLRVRDGHQFTVRADNFCDGYRPVEKLLYQYEPLVTGEFVLVDKADGQLGMGSHKQIKLIRARDGYEFSQRCAEFCEGHRPR